VSDPPPAAEPRESTGASAPAVQPAEEKPAGAAEAPEPGQDGQDELSDPITSLEELRAAADHDSKPQGELALEGGPKGRFEGEEPNLVEGEDLDIPPFLRQQK
jgi:hypothetical protein